MNWDQDFTIVDGTLYTAGGRWLGTFSSTAAAKCAIAAGRGATVRMLPDDEELLLAIDADEE